MTMACEKQNTAVQKTASLADLRTVIADRMQTAQRRLDPNSATAAFANASHHDSMIGSLIFGMVCWMPCMDMFGGQMDGLMAAAANSPTLAAAADGLSLVWDEKAHKNRRRGFLSVSFKDGIYHGGRNQAGNVISDHLKKAFNLVAANENAAYAYDAAAEVAGLAEMLDAIDMLERQGVLLLALDPAQPVSRLLQTAVKQKAGKVLPVAASPILRAVA